MTQPLPNTDPELDQLLQQLLAADSDRKLIKLVEAADPKHIVALLKAEHGRELAARLERILNSIKWPSIHLELKNLPSTNPKPATE